MIGGFLRSIRLQNDRGKSPLAQFSVGSSAHVCRRPAFGFPCEHATRALVNLHRLRRFDVRGVLGGGLVKAGQEFGGDIGTFVDRQGERFPEKLLPSGRHKGILGAPVQPNKTADAGVSRRRTPSSGPAQGVVLHRFLIVIESAGKNFSAYSPDLPGCVATGATREETERRMYEAVELHVEGLRQDKQPVPPSTSFAEYVVVRV